MPKHGKTLLLTLFLCLLFQFTATSQNLNLMLESGGSVPFNVNSLNKYKHGVELNEWTRWAISVAGIGESESWRIEVYAEDTKLQGDFGRELALNYISVSADPFDGGSGDLNYFIISELSDAPQTLVSGTGPGVYRILINYSIGTDPDNILLGEFPDYYFVDLNFHLKPD